MQTNETETYVYQEIANRLSDCHSYYDHDPMCMCEQPSICPRRSKLCAPTAYALQPLRDYELALSEANKTKIKTILKKENTPPPAPDPAAAATYLFVTINPRADVPLPKFIKKFETFRHSTIYADHCGVIEQRGTDASGNLGKGFHFHILFKRKTPLSEGLPPTNIKQKIRNSFKNFTNTKMNHLCNIQFVSTETAKEKLQYMLGVKLKSGKSVKQEGDRLWRPTVSISEFYGNKDLVEPT